MQNCSFQPDLYQESGKRHVGSEQESSKDGRSTRCAPCKENAAKETGKAYRDYDKFVKKSRKHTFEIQSDDVKARMKQNDADRKTREKNKSRKAHQATKKAGRKYN
jgi:hypothetical protein